MKALIMIGPVVAVGAVVGLGFAGVIQIPGITPKKAAKHAQANYAPDAESRPKATVTAPLKPVLSKPKDVAPPEDHAIQKDPEQGADALATVWNEIKAPELIAISASWKDEDFARVLAHMDTSLVAKLLDAMTKGDEGAKIKPDPKRASKLSKILQERASLAVGPAKTP